MTYGDDKVRDMCRSILPSTQRKSDRHNAERVRRRNRRTTRQTLHDWRMAADVDDFEGHVFGYEDSPAVGGGWSECQGSIKTVMWDRREHDKLGPMLRWAVAITADIDDPADRQEHMRAILPDNLIGRHAMGHIKFLDEFDTDVRIDYSRYHRNAGPMSADDVEAKLREMVATNHKRLNHELKKTVIRYVPAVDLFGHKYRKAEFANRVAGLHDAAFLDWARTYIGRQTLEKIFENLTH